MNCKNRALKGRDLSIEEHTIPVSDTYIEKVKSELF